jgi:hypothetical protein
MYLKKMFLTKNDSFVNIKQSRKNGRALSPIMDE